MHPRRRARAAWTALALSLLAGLLALLSTGSAVAGASGRSEAGGGAIKIVSVGFVRYKDSDPGEWLAIAKIRSTAKRPTDVSIIFTALKGAKVIDTVGPSFTVHPGTDVAIGAFVMPDGAGAPTAVRAKLDGSSQSSRDRRFVKVVGKPTYTHADGACKLSAKVLNPSGAKVRELAVSIVAYADGKIVAAAPSGLENLAAHATATADWGYLPCVPKVDSIEAYVD